MLLVETRRDTTEVAAACEIGRRAGVYAGMSRAHAHVLLGGRPALERPTAPEQDAAELIHLAEWAVQFSPIVAVDPPDGLLLDIAGCGHLFGGDAALLTAVRNGLRALGWVARVAAAPTFVAAWALARYGPRPLLNVAAAACEEALAELSPAALRLDEEQLDALTEVGLETIGQLARVSRAELAARFGAVLVRRLDQARGVWPETVHSIVPEAPLRVRRIFDGGVTQLETLRQTACELLDGLADALREACRGARRLRVVLQRVDESAVTIELPLTYPCQDATHLWTLLGPRLERVQMGFGVEEVLLEAALTEVVASRPLALWGRQQAEELATSDEVRGAFLDRLCQRFGAGVIRQVVVSESYAPERAFRFEQRDAPTLAALPPLAWRHQADAPDAPGPAGPVQTTKAGWPKATPKKHRSGAQTTTSGNPNASAAGDVFQEPGSAGPPGTTLVLPAARPTFLFEVPEPLRVLALMPDGPPRRIHWRGQEYAIVQGLGPERVHLPWWSSEKSHTHSGRDYFALRDELGRWLWVFRAHDEIQGWFLAGVWA